MSPSEIALPEGPPRSASAINRIVASSLRQRFLVVLTTLLLIVTGSWSLNRLPVEAYPDLSPPMVEIITQWPGRAAEEIERLITVPIEVEMNGIPKMTILRSISLYGLSDVRLTFRDGTDNYFARQRVFEHIAGLNLPTGVTPSVAPLFSPSGLIYRYVLQSPDRSPLELKTIEDWIVERQYKSVQGVADDAGLGGETMQYQVLLDPAKIAGAGLSVPQIVTALGANNGNAGGGFYSEGGQFYYVRGLGRLHTPEDIGNVVLAVSNGIPILVKNVGRVEIGYAPRLGQFGYQDQDDAVEGVILMRTGEKTQEVLKRVEAKTEDLNRNILPKDVKIHTFYDRTNLISLTTETVERNLLRGMVLVVVVLVFFLYDVRAGLIVATTIPLALLFAFICLDLRGVSANLLSIGAVDFGILVDGAVVMVENIFRQIGRAPWPAVQDHGSHRGRRRRGGPPHFLRRRGDRRGFPADLCSPGAVGQTLHADGRHDDLRAGRLANHHAGVAAGALLVGLPQRRARAAQPRLRGRQIRLHQRSRSLPRASLGHNTGVRAGARRFAATRSLRLATSSCLTWMKARSGFAPPCPTRSHSRNRRKIAPQVRQILRSFPEVTVVASEHGRPDDGTDPTGFFNVEFFVGLKPYREWKGAYRTKAKLIEAINEKLQAFPGIIFNYTQPAEDAVDEAETGLKSALAVKVFGTDLQTLETKGQGDQARAGRCAGDQRHHAGPGTRPAEPDRGY